MTSTLTTQKLCCNRRVKQLAKTSAAFLALVFLAGCASLTSTSSTRLDQQIARADMAYRILDAGNVSTYNKAVESIGRQMDGARPNELRSRLASLGVKLDQQDNIRLPLAAYHLVPRSRKPNESPGVGVPMLLDYDTSHAPLYPRDGLLISATAIYRRIDGKPHLSLLTGKNSIELNGSTYPLKIDNVAPITEDDASWATRRKRWLSETCSTRPRCREDREFFLTEPYDPNKTTLLMIPGLQSTPFAFVGSPQGHASRSGG